MKHVVIIGGGFAGSFIAKSLETRFDVTLIDNKDYFEFTPGILRTIILPQHSKKIQVLHSNYLKQTKIINGKVTKVSKTEVFIGTKKISFDYLVICSGSRYNTPIKEQNIVLATRAETLQKHHKKLDASKNVLIIGGGLVGVELAAEIIWKYKNKNITIVQSKNSLMDRNNLKAQEFAKKYLTKKGVKIIFNEIVLNNKKNVFITSRATTLKPDIAFLCTGIMPNSEFMQHNFKDKLTDKKFIKVNPFLQLEGSKNIFVAGDVNSILEEKTAQNSEEHAKLVIKNMIHQEKNEPLEEYKSSARAMVISLGPWCGILTYKTHTITGLLPGILKSVIELKAMQNYS